MSYRTDLHIDLINEGIYSSKKDIGFVKLNKGYYLTSDILSFLSFGEGIKFYAKNTTDFANLIGKTIQTVRNGVIERRFLVLQEGFYNKEKFLKYLLNKIS